MRIGDIIRENHPKNFNKMDKIRKSKLTERELKELMYHSSYKRSSRGAIKQVR